MSSELQNKLLSYEVAPPEKVWNDISLALDNQVPLEVSDKLSRFEATPPQNVWEKISKELDLKKGGPKIIRFNKPRRTLKYAGLAAAVVLGVVFGSRFIGNETDPVLRTDQNVFETKINQAPAKVVQQTPEPDNTTSAQPSIVRNDKLPQQGTSQKRVSYTPNEDLTFLENLIPESVERRISINYKIPADKYMIYTTSTTEPVRVPKKLFDAIACKTEDIVCQQRIKNLQEKVASSAVTTDFTGFLEILDNLQENP